MSERDLIPEDSEHKTESDKPYVLVPQLRLLGAGRLNIAGWSDRGGEAYVCETCKKQVRLSLTELRIFPLVKKDTDLFRFVYRVPNHRSGGAFSVEVCKGSEKEVLRDHEVETSVRFTGESKKSITPESSGAEGPPDSLSPARDEEVKKKVETMSSQEAEERYNELLKRPITELTDAEYAERLALVERLTAVKKKPSSK